MTQSATVFTAEDIFIYNPKSFTIQSDSTKAEEIVSELKGGMDFAESANAFTYNNRIRFSFRAGLNEKLFVLLKGLIEFHRPKNFLFKYDKAERSIEADVHEGDYAALKKFLANINHWLNKELGFRSALKDALAFEARYKAERAAVYGSVLKRSVSA